MTSVEPIPEGYAHVTPYLHVDGAAAALDFYIEVLGATERMRMPGDGPDSIGHAEIQVGDGVIMLADEFPDEAILAPTSIGGTSVTIHVYVDDVDGVFAGAVEAGARPLEEPVDQVWGDRTAKFEDPFGHRWLIARNVEDVPPDEVQRRMEELAGG